FGSVGRVSRATFGSGDTGACATGGAAGVAVGAVGAAACGATSAGAAGCCTGAGGETDFTTSCSWLPGGRVCIGGGVAPDDAAGAGGGAVTVADSVWPGCGRLAGGRAADGSGGLAASCICAALGGCTMACSGGCRLAPFAWVTVAWFGLAGLS